MQTGFYCNRVETFWMGLNVSTGLTYLQQPGLKQLFTCVWQQPGTLIKTQALNISNTEYFYIWYEKVRWISCFYKPGLHNIRLRNIIYILLCQDEHTWNWHRPTFTHFRWLVVTRKGIKEVWAMVWLYVITDFVNHLFFQVLFHANI